MIGWVIINVVSAVLVAMIVAYKLGAYPHQFTLGEQVGMGLIAAGMLMRIGPIVGKNLIGQNSPFDDWSVLLLHVGLAIYFIARIVRVHRHWYRNEIQKQLASDHFGGVGRVNKTDS